MSSTGVREGQYCHNVTHAKHLTVVVCVCVFVNSGVTVRVIKHRRTICKLTPNQSWTQRLRLCPFTLRTPKRGFPQRSWILNGEKVAGLIWNRFAAEALRFIVEKSSRPPHEMRKFKVKSTTISRFKLFQVFATQKSWIHRPHPDVDDENRGTFTSTKYLNVCWLVRWTKFLLFGYFSAGECRRNSDDFWKKVFHGCPY